MPDPMSNAEIEDVLSSIRRLVSEDVRSQRVQRLTLTETAKATGPTLVLTPAQRVEEPSTRPAGDHPLPEPESGASDETWVDIALRQAVDEPVDAPEGSGLGWAEAAILGNQTTEPSGPDRIAALERTISELEAAVAGIEGEFEPDAGETVEAGSDGSDLHVMFGTDVPADELEEDAAYAPASSDPMITDASDADAFASTEQGFEQGPEEGADAELIASPSWAASSLSDAAVAEQTEDHGLSEEQDEAADTGEEFPAWNDGLDTGLTEGRIAGLPTFHPAEDLDQLPEPVHEGDLWLADAADDGAPATTDALAEDEPLVAEADALSDRDPLAAVSLSRLHLTASMGVAAADEPLPDSATPVDEFRRSPRILRAEATEPVPVASEQDEGNLFDGGEEAVIDADALRDLVVEIIRQELQGALGERITRNVRKLVRREVNRVLDTRVLE